MSYPLYACPRTLSGGAAVACLAAFLMPSSAQAQYPYERYQPQTATVSPYLNLLRQNTAGLPSYYSLVRPQLEFDASRRRQNIVLQQQQRAIDALQYSTSRTERLILPTGKQGRFFDTGSTAGFMTTSHFYPPPRSRPRKR